RDLSITNPETEEQHALLALWKEYLRVEGIGIDTDFFEAGGDSILAMLITARAQECGIALAVADFFGCRTVRGLCGPTGRAQTSASSSACEGANDIEVQREAGRLIEEYCGDAEVEDSFAASLMEVGMLFHTVLEPASGVYYEQSTHVISGPLDV